MKIELKILLLVLTLNAALTSVWAQSSLPAEVRASEIDSFLRATYPSDEPGGAVIVVHNGEVLHKGAYGMANLELDVPLEPNMIFQIGSLTKQFTAAGILMLQEQGKLSVDDPITRHVADYGSHGDGITIKHLLTHTSGIWAFTSVEEFSTRAVRLDVTAVEQVNSFKDQSSYFEPGEHHAYNNSGYVILGAIIEALSGKSYGEFIKDEIFSPLGMDSSQFGGHQLVANRVSGYPSSDGEYRNARYVSITQPYSAGGLLSNVDDFARWDKALINEALPGVSYKSMGERATLNGGEIVDYGYGLTYIDVLSRQAIGHGGGFAGFQAISLRLLEDDLYVAVLLNNPGKQPNRTEIARNVAAIALGEPYPGTGE